MLTKNKKSQHENSGKPNKIILNIFFYIIWIKETNSYISENKKKKFLKNGKEKERK